MFSAKKTDVMVTMGYNRKDIEDSLAHNKYDSLTATYLLLGRTSNDVSMHFLSHKLDYVMANGQHQSSAVKS
jgi:hypothetical protein